MRPFTNHLDNDEIDELVSLDPQTVSDSGSALREAQRHINSCHDCSQKLQMHKSVRSKLLRLGEVSNVPFGLDCVPEVEWLNLAAGLLPELQTRGLMKHAAQCGHCGPLLRNAAVTLSDEATRTEEEVLFSLGSAQSGWQTHMARTLRARSHDLHLAEQGRSWWHALFSWPRPVVAVAVVATFVAASWLGFRALRPPSAQQLLAQAYTEHRTLEVRIPGARYAPMRVERTSGGSNVDKSSALLKAEALIAESLKNDPNDPSWLLVKGRADLLDGNFESAITSLRQGLETQPNSPQLLTDLASAYFLRAEAADRPSDYGNAVEALSRALAESPNDQVSLFNRALVSEHLFLFQQAADDWDHYLSVDSVGPWADEARTRRAALQEKLKKHTHDSSRPLFDVAGFTMTASSSNGTFLNAIDDRVEEYLDVGIRKWLPIAFPPNALAATNERSVFARQALRELARVLADRHGDNWFGDFLSGHPSQEMASAIQALSQAAEANADGQPSVGRTQAVEAEHLFRLAQNRPGILRAQLEELYSLHRLFRSSECLRLGSTIETNLQGVQYTWIATQLRLEQFACFSSQAKMDRGAETISSALRSADSDSYKTLALRAAGLAATLETQKGNRTAAELLDLGGLRTYWSAVYPPLRAYQFYDDLTDQAQRAGQWHLAVALGREAVAAATASGNRSFEAIAHFQLAISACMAGIAPQAEGEYVTARRLFSSLPADSGARAFEADAEIHLAEAEAINGLTDKAETRLTEAKSSLPASFDSYTTWLAFYRTTARISESHGDEHGLRRACTAAVVIAERALRTIVTEDDRFTWSRAASSCYRSLVTTALRNNNPVLALELWEWYQGAAARSSRPTVDSPAYTEGETTSLPLIFEVENNLQKFKHDTVLAYAELSDQIAIWIYDDRGIYWATVPAKARQVAQLGSRFAAQCSDPTSDINLLRANGRVLYDWLVGPVSAHLESSRTLLIEPDGILSGVPFQALVDTEGSYVGWQHAIAYSPGLSYTLRLRTTSSVSLTSKALVVGEPAISAHSNTRTVLPDANREARWVNGRFSNSVLLTGREATAHSLLRHLSRTAVFHFAGHSISSADETGLEVATDESSDGTRAILLAPDRIAMADLTSLRLVILSACATAHAGDTGFGGPGNLVAVFLRAGVPHVIASRWNIDSAATARIMAFLYPVVITTESASRSLLVASRQASNYPGSSHPYFWAGFSVYGRT